MIFLIIFGTRGVTYSHNQGQFHCPECGQQRPYAHKRVRRFFTLYFIPLIPLDLLGEYIECGSCQGTYKESVLSYDPGRAGAQEEARFREAIKRTMVMMMLADGAVDESEVETIRDIYGKITGRPIERAEVEQEIQQARSDRLSVEDYLGGVIGMLNDKGKELVVKAAFFVAAADGKFEDSEKQLLGRIAKSLQMTSAHFQGIVSELTGGGAQA
jgi:tellurite resistance protein